jgi:hypothetical protein
LHISPRGERDQERARVSADDFERDAWTSTPLLRRRGDPLSNWTKLLSGAAVAAVLGGYFIFGSSDRPADVAITPEPAIGVPEVAFSSLREAEVRSAKMATTVESRAVPEAQMVSSEPMGRLDIKPTKPQTENQLIAESGHDSTCFPSASAALLNHPGVRPSWTLRAPGHEGLRCWYAATRTNAEAGTPSARGGGMTVESRAEPEGETVLLSQPAGRLDMKPTEVKMDAKQPQTLPDSEEQLFATRGHGSTCYPSASDVRQNHPGAWPSWTLRAPGHEGTRCWYAGTPARQRPPTNVEARWRREKRQLEQRRDSNRRTRYSECNDGLKLDLIEEIEGDPSCRAADSARRRPDRPTIVSLRRICGLQNIVRTTTVHGTS